MNRSTVEEIGKSLQYFGIVDYAIFIIMLVICAAIGIYFGFEGHRLAKRQINRRRESLELNYLVGGRTLKIFPVAMSLVASRTSGIILLGGPTEIYLNGTEYMTVFAGIIMAGIIVNYVFLPIYIEMELTSIYQYLEARFDKRTRMFGSILYLVSTIIYLPIVIYVPALAFNQVTGIDILIITPLTCLVCVFYTTVGGMKAVVWTDVIQTVIVYGTITVILVKGTLDAGGIEFVWQKNWESGRIEMPPLSLDPTIRHTYFSLIFGGLFFWIQAISVNQGIVQRYVSMPNLRAARKALLIFIIGILLIKCLSCLNGLVLYATYYDCDPLQTKLAKAKDQLLPILVMQLFKNVPGMPGLFVAGIFSAALSSLSTALNSLSAVVLEDFVKPAVKKPLSEFQTNLVMRGVVVLCGAIAVGLVVLVQHLGQVLQLSIRTGGVANGPSLAIFIMGLMMPWINGKCALFGGVTSLVVMFWQTYQSQIALLGGALNSNEKPLSVDGCEYDFVAMNKTAPPVFTEDTLPAAFYRLSYMWTTLFAFTITIIFSHLGMLIFGREDGSNIKVEMIAPFLRKYFKASKFIKVQQQDADLASDDDDGTKIELTENNLKQ